MRTKKKERLLSPLLLAFMGTMILANIAAQMILPLQSLYVQELGATIEQVGIFFTIAAIAPLFFQIFGGWLSDSIGRLQAIALGSLAGASAYIFYIFAPSWQWLLPSTVLTSLAIAFVSPSFQAFIAEESTAETRGRVYGITSTMFTVVSIIGPLVGGAIAQGRDFRLMYIVAACLFWVATMIRVGMARYASRKSKASGKPAAEKPNLGSFKKSLLAVFSLLMAGGVITWIFISDGVRDVAFSLTGQLMPLYLENEMGLSLFQISTLQSITAVVAMVLMSPAGWLSDKKGERVGIVGGFGFIAMGWTIFLFGNNFWIFVISRLFTGAGWAFIQPAYSALISKAVPERLRGTAFGFFSSSLGLISLPAPYIGALLWENVNPICPFYIPLIAMVAMMPLMWVKFKLPPEAEQEAAAPKSEAPSLGAETTADASPAGD
jgi:MFS family permease